MSVVIASVVGAAIGLAILVIINRIKYGYWPWE